MLLYSNFYKRHKTSKERGLYENEKEVAQADLIAVNKMYTTIFNEIKSIGEETGTLTQIIIVDHVDGKRLECKEEFESYIRCNWRNNTGLI